MKKKKYNRPEDFLTARLELAFRELIDNGCPEQLAIDRISRCFVSFINEKQARVWAKNGYKLPEEE